MPPLLWALPAMALLLADEGENEHAVELYALASRYPLVAKSRWFADVMGKEIAAAAAILPAESSRPPRGAGPGPRLESYRSGAPQRAAYIGQLAFGERLSVCHPRRG